MRKLLTAALLAATVFPTAAMAQYRGEPSRGELYRDRQDIGQERRDLGRAYASGDRRDIRDERGDLRDARQEYHEDRRDVRHDRDRRWGRDDWRTWRGQHGALYARGRWNAPFRYQVFRPGVRIAPGYYGTRYVIADPWRYRLPPVRGASHWVRHYNDVLLIDYRRGIVLDVIRNFYR